MDTITISDLEVSFHVGVGNQERAKAQRLLLTVEMQTDFTEAAASDDLTKTVDYFAVSQRLLKLGDGKSWRLIEKLAEDISMLVLKEFKVRSVAVEVKKFIIPQTRFVSVRIMRPTAPPI
jgi:dihydroneopterin aldolase